MSTKTTNLNLDKPELGDTPNITIPQLASNFEIIDEQLAQNTSLRSNIFVDVTDKQFGAKGDGIANDAPAIRNAISYAISNGYTKVKVPKGTYLINSLSGTQYNNMEFAIVLDNNISLIGDDGAVLKFGDNMYQKTSATAGAALILADTKDRVSVRNLKIDMNGNNNLMPLGYTYIIGYPICFNNCTNVVIENNEIINTFGRNSITLRGRTNISTAGNNAIIRGNVIHNGGTSLTGNDLQTDYSAIYCDYSNALIEKNRVYHDQYPFHNSGGIEIHGDKIICKNNVIEKSHPAVYISSDYSGSTLENIIVSDNVFTNCNRGVYLFGYGDFDGIQIRNNLIDLTLNPNNIVNSVTGILMPRDDSGNFTISGTVYTLKTNNIIIDGNDITENFTTNPATAAGNGIVLSSVFNAIISNNLLHHFSGGCITLRGCPYGINNVSISNNIFKDYGLNGGAYSHDAITMDFTGSSTNPAKSAYDAKNITVKQNKFYLDESITGITAYGFYFNWSASSAISNIIVSDNELVNVNAKEGAQSALVDVIKKAKSFGTSGYEITSSGRIVQWKSVYYTATANTDQVVTLPTTFPNACMFALVTPTGVSSLTATTNGVNTNSVTIRCSVQNTNVYVYAVGY